MIYFSDFLENSIIIPNFDVRNFNVMNIFKKILGWLQFFVDLIKYLTNYKSK